VDGFTNRFGLTYIDYKNASLPRYPKKSSHWYSDYARTHAVYDKEGRGSEIVGNDEEQGQDNDYGGNFDDYETVEDGDHGNSDPSISVDDDGKDKKKDKGGGGKGDKKDGDKDDIHGGVGGDLDNDPFLPTGDDYTKDGSEDIENSQRSRMKAVVSQGGWIDYLHAALGSNRGASIFGPQGAVAW
jgi:hypothetical protein